MKGESEHSSDEEMEGWANSKNPILSEEYTEEDKGYEGDDEDEEKAEVSGEEGEDEENDDDDDDDDYYDDDEVRILPS